MRYEIEKLKRNTIEGCPESLEILEKEATRRNSMPLRLWVYSFRRYVSWTDIKNYVLKNPLEFDELDLPLEILDLTSPYRAGDLEAPSSLRPYINCILLRSHADIPKLKEFHNLKRLESYQNSFEKEDLYKIIENITNPEKITDIYFNGLNLFEIKPFLKFRNLKRFHTSGRVRDIELLKNFPLESVSFQNSPNQDLSFLLDMPYLKSIIVESHDFLETSRDLRTMGLGSHIDVRIRDL